MKGKKITEGINQVGIPTVLAVLSTAHPEYIGLLTLICGCYTYLSTSYYQERVEKLFSFIKRNKEKFSQELISTNEFKEGFLIIFDSYVKERNSKKRDIIKSILVGFTEIPNELKEEFELERLLDITYKITADELRFIYFLNNIIRPIQEEFSRKEALSTYERTKELEGGESYEFWYDWNIKTKPLTKHLSRYYFDLHNPNSNKAKEIYNHSESNDVSSKMFKDEEEENDRSRDLISGLNSLGLLKPYLMSDGGGIGTGGTQNSYEYNFSTLGEKFIKYSLNV